MNLLFLSCCPVLFLCRETEELAFVFLFYTRGYYYYYYIIL